MSWKIYVLKAASSLTNGMLSDQYGCDKMIFLVVLLWEIRLLLQAFAINIGAGDSSRGFIAYSAGWLVFNLGESSYVF